jgi:hypothetical protein
MWILRLPRQGYQTMAAPASKPWCQAIQYDSNHAPGARVLLAHPWDDA